MNTPDISATQLDASLIATVEEWSEKLRHGESITLDDYLARFPDRTSQIRELYATIQAVNQLGEGYGDCDEGSSATAPKTLGEFQIVREVARGGMGIVYEALQTSLDRRVALKVLPLATLLSEAELARFKNETRAAATLHHPNIVPIYSVGITDGVHHYAMQFIDGPSLAQVVKESTAWRGARASVIDETAAINSESDRPEQSSTAHRQVTTGDTRPEVQAMISTMAGRDTQDRYRVAAGWILQAARALAYAHRNGVLHRDIKPANLLIDRWCNVWLTDFGLARIEGDPSMTATGQLMGTLRYVAPEQVRQDVVVDHRADIYGLGLTLYELIALKPAFDAERYDDLIQQIRNRSVKSLRAIDSSIPQELGVIVSKAIEKDREDRYSSAEEFANDLQAFLDRRPIKARPLSYWQHGARWVRNHQRSVAAVAAALVLATTFLAVTSLVILDQRRTAEVAKERSDHNFALAQQAVDQLLTRVADDALLNEPHMERLRATLLQDAVAFYNKLAAAAEGAPKSQLQAAVAEIKLGRALMLIGRTNEAYQKLRKGTEEVRRLLPITKDDRQTRVDLALGLRSLGRVASLQAGQDVTLSQDEHAKYKQEAASSRTQGIKLLEQLTGKPSPDAELLLSRLHLDAAEELPKKSEARRDHLEKAVQAAERCVEADSTSGAMLQLAMSLDTLSLEMRALGKHDQRFTLWERALVIAQDLVDRYPRHPEGRYFLSCFLGNTSTYGGNVGDKDPRPRSLQLAQDLHEEFPAVQRYQWGLAMEYYNMATVAAIQGADWQEVVEMRERAVELLERLWQANPEQFAFRGKLFENLDDLQEYARYRCDAESRHRYLDKLMKIAEKTTEVVGDWHVAGARSRLAQNHMMMAIGLYPLSRVDEARQHLQSAREINSQLIKYGASIDSPEQRQQVEGRARFSEFVSLTAQMNCELVWGDVDLARSVGNDALQAIEENLQIVDEQSRDISLYHKAKLLVADLPTDLRRPEAGLRLSQELVARKPDEMYHQKVLAQALFANGQYAESQRWMEQLRNESRQRDRQRKREQFVRREKIKKPEDPSYSLYIAICAFHLDDHETATSEFAEVTRRWGSCDAFPDSARLYRETAQLLGSSDFDSIMPSEPTKSLPPIRCNLGRRAWNL